jgi:hypothetical protein
MEFSGRLSSFPIGDLLQWAHNDRRTGSLVVRRSGREKQVFFRDGDVVSCFSDDAAEFFGQHLLVQGLVSDNTLIRALTYCQKQGKRLGVVLGELGILREDVVSAALTQQIQDLVCDIFLWKSGVFFFAAEMPPEEDLLPQPLPAVGLAMEGSRWADEYGRIRRLYVHDNIVLGRGRGPSPKEPSPLERRLLRAVDGRRTLDELYNEVRGSYFRFLHTAYDLTVREVLDIHTVGDAGDTASTELRLTDLLIEQVAEEEAVFLRHHLALPFDAIERYVPVWVQKPDEDERGRMPPEIRQFYDAIDGRRSLSQLLAGAGDERARRLDRLILQLRKGALALLPTAIEDLGATATESGGSWWRRLANKS